MGRTEQPPEPSWSPPRTPADAGMRASDAERSAVGDILAKHYADGRLDPTEFDERMGLAMKAKTRGDLTALLTDLPGEHHQPAQRHRLGASALTVMVLLLVFGVLASLVPPHAPVFLLVLGACWLWLAARRGRRSGHHLPPSS